MTVFDTAPALECVPSYIDSRSGANTRRSPSCEPAFDGLGAVSRARRSRAEGRLAFLTDFAVLAGGQGASMLMGFVAFAFLARTLEPEAYGVVEYTVGVSFFLASVVDGGLRLPGLLPIATGPA